MTLFLRSLPVLLVFLLVLSAGPSLSSTGVSPSALPAQEGDENNEDLVEILTRGFEIWWDAEASFPLPEAVSADARLQLDFTYDPQNLHRFVTERGPQLQSVYYYSRYDALYYNQGRSALLVFRKEHPDMMLAEASVQLDKKQQAIDIINSGTRVNRGGLDPLPDTASDEEVLEAIYYEVEIELQRTWVGYQYFMNRRREILQAGTPN